MTETSLGDTFGGKETFDPTFTVHGDHGEILADPTTGEVAAFYGFDDAFREHQVTTYDGIRILRFDVAEYAAWNGGPVGEGDTIDICAIGYWHAADSGEAFEPAVPSYRARMEDDADRFDAPY